MLLLQGGGPPTRNAKVVAVLLWWEFGVWNLMNFEFFFSARSLIQESHGLCQSSVEMDNSSTFIFLEKGKCLCSFHPIFDLIFRRNQTQFSPIFPGQIQLAQVAFLGVEKNKLYLSTLKIEELVRKQL